MTQQELELLQILQAQEPRANSSPDVQIDNRSRAELDRPPVQPQVDPAESYNHQAGAYRTQADSLEREAATPYPQPHGVGERVVSALRAGMENFGRLGAPGGYYGQEQIRQKQFNDENKTRLDRAKELRNQSQQQQELGATVAQRGVTNRQQDEQIGLTRDLRDQQAAAGRRAETTANAPKYTPVQPGQPVMQTAPGQPPTFTTAPGEKPVPAKTPHTINTAQGVLQYDEASDSWKKVADTKPDAGADDMQIVQGKLGPDGEPSYIRVPKSGLAGVVSVGGEAVGTKPAEAPTQLKNQGDSAFTTTQMAGIVRNLVKMKPQLVGAVAGRVNELALRFGDNPTALTTLAGGMQPGDEKDAALLAGHMAYLFLNEARATMPGRPSKDYMDFVKQRSAQMSQSPQFIEGYLQSAENNAQIIMDLSERSGYSPWKRGTAPATPGAIPPAAPTGKVIRFDANGKRIK